MERGSDKHSPRMDDTLEHEVEGLLHSGQQSRGEEWNEAEPSGEDQPDVGRGAGTALVGGVPEGMTPEDVQARSELGQWLGPTVWPASGAQLVAVASERGAPADVVSQLSYLPPERSFGNLQQAWAALSGGVEQHRS